MSDIQGETHSIRILHTPADGLNDTANGVAFCTQKEKLEAEVNEEPAVEEHVYPSPVRLLLLVIGIAIVVFSVALDNTIIATAIPTITSVFHSLDDVGWYGSAYLLTSTSLQPIFGKIYVTFDVKKTYLVAITLFEVGSVVCASSNSSTMLIIGRAVAGIGASGLYSGGLTVVGLSVPPSKFPFYISVLSSMYGVASVVGPILGGALTIKVSWRWCFWINLPFGGLAFLVVLCFFDSPKRNTNNTTLLEKIKTFDFLGSAFLICSIVCLLLALQWGGNKKPWSAPLIWGLILGFVLIFLAFCIVQWRRGDSATIPPRLFLRQWSMCSCAFYAFLLYMGRYSHIYFIPFYFQAGKGASPEDSGIKSIPYLVSTSIFSIVAGAIVAKIGLCVHLMAFGAGIFAIGSGLLTTLKVSSNTATSIGFQLLAGVGVGIGSQLPYAALQVVLRREDMPIGNAIVIFFITLGGAVSIPISQAILTNTLAQQVPILAPGANVSAIIQGGVTALDQIIPPDELGGVRDAYVYALDKVFILPTVVAGLAFVVSLFTQRNPKSNEEISS